MKGKRWEAMVRCEQSERGPIGNALFANLFDTLFNPIPSSRTRTSIPPEIRVFRESKGCDWKWRSALVLNRNFVVLNLNPVVAGEIKKKIKIMIKKPED